MKDILEYTSYRQYIADYYADKKAKSAFTWQEFTRAAGFSSPVHLKYASEGKLNLSDAAALRVAQAMHLAGYEQDYFCEMVKFDNRCFWQNAFNCRFCQGENHRRRFIPLF